MPLRGAAKFNIQGFKPIFLGFKPNIVVLEMKSIRAGTTDTNRVFLCLQKRLREKNVIVCKNVADDSNDGQIDVFMDGSFVPCDLVLAFRTVTNRPPVGVSILA